MKKNTHLIFLVNISPTLSSSEFNRCLLKNRIVRENSFNKCEDTADQWPIEPTMNHAQCDVTWMKTQKTQPHDHIIT